MTNCGTQLINMLEELNELGIYIHFDLIGKSWDAEKKKWIERDYVVYQELQNEFMTWLHNKNKKTYHGLLEEVHAIQQFGEYGDSIKNGWYECWKNNQEVKGIKVYG